MHLCRSSSSVPRLPSFLEMLQIPNVLLTFDKVHSPWRLLRETTSERPKVVRTCGVFTILTSKCASRQNSVHFFDISSSKSCLNVVCFVHFDFETCFAPQRHALFRNLTFQKCSECQMFCTFWLRNVLRTTTACTFVTSQLPKVLRMWGVFSFFTYKCASHHNGLHFFDIAASKSAPKLKSFVHLELDMCFAPQRRAIVHLSSGQLAPHPPLQRTYFLTPRSRKSLEKHSVSRLSYLFARLDLLSSETFSFLIFFSSLLFSSLTLPISAFYLSILSEVWL